ncbi:MAG: tRNA pseudouridine(55) synthase TruB [Acidobacteriota bacterium]
MTDHPPPVQPAAAMDITRGGVLVVDKPAGPTSHDVVAVVRRALRGARVGHTGTLDPFATGVLPIVVGRATRLAQFLSHTDKAYEARISLGRATDTYDFTGATTFESADGRSWPSPHEIARALTDVVGPVNQVPPPFSAKKSGGVKAYERARRGVPVALEPAAVTLHSLDVLAVDGHEICVRLVCSAGFYVRSLAHDLGVRLGTGAHLSALRRTRSGPFLVGDAVSLDSVVMNGPDLAGQILPIDDLLPWLPAVSLTPDGVRYVLHGRDIGPDQLAGDAQPCWPPRLRLLGPGGALLAVAEPAAAGFLHPTVVLV